MKLATRLSNLAFGVVMSTSFRPGYTPRTLRRNFEWIAGVTRKKLLAKYPTLQFEDVTLGGAKAEIVRARPDAKRTILYLHGGGYIMGSISTYRWTALRLSWRCNADVILLDYRLAPDTPYPAALEDAKRAWIDVAQRFPKHTLFIAGDSAGGGLTLATLLVLRDEKLPLPKAAVVLSPWTDHTSTSASVKNNHGKDTWLNREHLDHWSPYYRGLESAKNPLISPLYGNLEGLPPLLFIVGDQEVLLDDSTRFATKVKAAGGTAEVEIGHDMQHDYPISIPWLSESKAAWKRIERFLGSIG